MIGSLFNQTEDNLLLREEITQSLASVLSREFYAQGNRIPYLGGPEEHSLFYKLITEQLPTCEDEQSKRNLFRGFISLHHIRLASMRRAEPLGVI